jgi:hypothetical protein
MGITVKSIYRHVNGQALPREEHPEAYEAFFTKKLGRPIKLKRQRKVTERSPLQSSAAEKPKGH